MHNSVTICYKSVDKLSKHYLTKSVETVKKIVHTLQSVLADSILSFGLSGLPRQENWTLTGGILKHLKDSYI